MFRRLPAAVVALCCLAASLSGGSVSNAEQASPDILPLTTASGSAQTLDPGLYAGEVQTGATRYAKVTRSPTETITVSLITGPTVADKASDISVELQLPDGTSCDKDTTSTLRIDGASKMRSALVAIEQTPTRRGTSYLPKGCNTSTDLLLAVQISQGPRVEGHLVVLTEPRTTGSQGSAAAGQAQTPPLAPSMETTGEPVGGTGSYATATTLVSGSYPLTLQPRRLETFRVRVGWGQQVGVSLEAPRNGTDVAPSVTMNVGLTLWSPQLVPINANTVGNKRDTTRLTAKNATPEVIATGSATVAWNNRNETRAATDSGLSTGALAWASVAGWYYVTVWSTALPGPPSTGTPTTPPSAARSIPTRLNVVVKGTAAAGPNYVDAGGTAISSPEPTALSTGGDSPGLPWIRIGLSGLVLVLGGLAVAWSISRMRRSRI